MGSLHPQQKGAPLFHIAGTLGQRGALLFPFTDFHLVKHIVFVFLFPPLSVLKGFNHHWKYVFYLLFPLDLSNGGTSCNSHEPKGICHNSLVAA